MTNSSVITLQKGCEHCIDHHLMCLVIRFGMRLTVLITRNCLDDTMLTHIVCTVVWYENWKPVVKNWIVKIKKKMWIRVISKKYFYNCYSKHCNLSILLYLMYTLSLLMLNHCVWLAALWNNAKHCNRRLRLIKTANTEIRYNWIVIFKLFINVCNLTVTSCKYPKRQCWTFLPAAAHIWRTAVTHNYLLPGIWWNILFPAVKSNEAMCALFSVITD